MTRYSPIAAVLVLLAALIPTILPTSTRSAQAQDVIYAPEGGKLEAFDGNGNIIGPCPLEGTDVDVAISGRFTRVTLKQKFRNPYPDKIEAVYTFPMSHRAAVDRMTMIIGERIVIGEVKERQQARRIYEAARESGHMASLLEQERPNIFTQSVANIEPKAEIDVQISYVELLESKDGTFTFDFPMVVGPRYIPGAPKTSLGDLSGNYKPRRGVILLGPAGYRITQGGDPKDQTALRVEDIAALMARAQAIETPDDSATERKLMARFEADYADGEKETGNFYADGTGHVNGRWFCVPRELLIRPGAAFSPDTTQVPDAGKITPMPVRPEQRAGHDISISVTIDTGGPGILDVKSELHQIITTKAVKRDDGASRKLTVELTKEREIPNRDFVLSWRQTADTIQEAAFTHTGKQGNFFSLILQPPARVADAQAVARELVFVLDTSGSMSNFPIEKAKEVMTKAIGALRPQDTFNLITFSGDTHILWNKPRSGTKENIEAAQQFLATRAGGGGTEMMKAIEAALVQAPQEDAREPLTIEQLLNLPADGRVVQVRVPPGQPVLTVTRTVGGLDRWYINLDRHSIPVYGLPSTFSRAGTESLTLEGQWATQNQERVLNVQTWRGVNQPAAPMRICCFMTDGYVGNDQAIIDAVRKNAKTTRVFSFGIGNSVNRFLLDGMARAGRGEVEYVLLQSDGDAAAKRFAERIQTPVLTDIELVFSDGLKITEMTPKTLPDLFDVKPIILHGRYATPGSGTLTIRGRTAGGRYERVMPLELPANDPEHDTIATLWARAKVDQLMNENLAAAQTGNFPAELRNEVVKLGETFGIMTQYTSFVAVEKQRVTIGGQPRLVHVPIEMPQGVSYEGVFGGEALFRLMSRTAQEWRRETPGGSTIWYSLQLGGANTQPADRLSGDSITSGASVDRLFGADLLDDSEDWSDLKLEEEQAERVITWDVRVQRSEVVNGDWGVANLVQALPAVKSNEKWEMSTAGHFGGYGGSGRMNHLYFDKADGGRFLGFHFYNDDDMQWRSVTGLKPAYTSRNDNDVPGQKPRRGKGRAAEGEGGREASFAYEVAPSVDLNGAAANLNGALTSQYGLDAPYVKVDSKSRRLIVTGTERDQPAVGALLARIAPGSAATQPAVVSAAATRPAGSALHGRTLRIIAWLDALAANGRLDWARKELVPQRVAIQIGELAKAGGFDDAKALTEALVKFDGEFKIAAQMREVLGDAKIAAAKRDQQMAALADEARKVFDPIIRELKLRRRVDERLQAIAHAGPAAATQPAPAEAALVNGNLRVSVLADNVETPTLDRMRKAGLKVEATARPVRMVVGLVPRERLADLALLDSVRRVELTGTHE